MGEGQALASKSRHILHYAGDHFHRHEQAMVSEPLEGVLCPNIQPRQRRSKFFCSPDNKTPGVELALSGCWWGKLVA